MCRKPRLQWICPDGPDEADDDEQEEVAEELAESASSLFGVDVKMVDR